MGAMARGQDEEKFAGAQAAPPFALAAMILGNICLAFGPMFVRMSDVGPVSAAFWRIALAAPLLFVIAAFAGDPARKLPRGLVWLFLISGFLFAADLAAWHVGILQTKLANANLLGNSTVFLLPLYAFIVARAWPTKQQSLALVLAGAGAVLLLGRSFELSAENLEGDLLCILAGIFYTAYLILMARARGGMGQWPVLAWSTAMSVVPLLIFAFVLRETIMPQDWTPLIALAFFSQIAGQGLMIYVIGRVPPLLFSITLLIQPMIAATVGWVIYGERLGALDWVGAVLIGLALVLVQQPEAKAKP